MPPRAKTLPEAASFRDRDARLFREGERVARGLSSDGLADWRALSRSALFERFTATEELIGTADADAQVLDAIRDADPEGGWVAALVHERLPFVSYPYEWSFSMLQGAALLQLRLMAAALTQGLTMKDASPYNIQWRGSRPVFVDIGSFERARPGEPWAGYRQFCMLFLYPLLLEAYRGVAFQPWLRGRIDGIPAQEFRRLFALRDGFRPGVFKHVFLHASLERRNEARSSDLRGELSEAGFDSRIVAANVTKLEKLVRGLSSPVGRSTWQDYRATCSYDEEDRLAKEQFVRRVISQRRRQLAWDLGCNDGHFSRIASGGADLTLAIDSDAATVDDLYRSLHDSRETTILPLVVDLADPSPGLGWRNQERAALLDRGAPDLTLCLALVHHLSIARNLPLREVVDWLRSLDSEVVVEFAHRDDPMVERLLANKRPGAHPDYELEVFDRLLRDSFEIVESLPLPSGMRTLDLVRPA